MHSQLPDLQSRRGDLPDLALRLRVLAIALVVIFLAAVLNAALPLRLSDPRWLQLLVQVLLEKGVLPLIALALLYLAVVLNPASTRLRRRRDRYCRLATWAAIGFGLLIPLQIASSWGSLNLASAGQQQQRLQGAAVITSLRQAVSAATSHQDLEQRLRALPIARSAPPTAADLALPFPERKQRILAGLQRSEQELAAAGSSAPIPWLALLETTLRIAPTALALAAGYAAFGIGIGGSTSPQSAEEQVYLESLSRDRPAAEALPAAGARQPLRPREKPPSRLAAGGAQSADGAGPSGLGRGQFFSKLLRGCGDANPAPESAGRLAQRATRNQQALTIRWAQA